MRNLKKILALVLAMVMSLSLMATASAAESTAAANDYTLATNVLKGLDVVIGDPDGAIRENDNITRAEVATLAYRIHTADVKDSKADLYRDLAAFGDLGTVAWAQGYIGYAYNAEIVKGNGDGTFNPNGKITGYEVLAMALRSIGYGKNNEFVGTEWQINTAAWARREGLLEGVSALDQTRLDQPATRGMVFQVLFNAIQHEDVDISYITTGLYNGLGDTMANRLGLEKISGVVTANEWADLDNNVTLADGKTRVELDDGSTRTLDRSAGSYADGVKEIGKRYDMYIRDKAKVLDEKYSDKNDVKDNNGEETTVNTLKGSIKLTDDTKYFGNFDPLEEYYSDYRIEYNLRLTEDGLRTLTQVTGVTLAKLQTWMDEDVPSAKNDANGNPYYKYAFVKVLPADKTINSAHLSIMKAIFTIADNSNRTLDIDGSVYVGTRSGDASDASDTMSYKAFEEQYIAKRVDKIEEIKNGNWLQVIDHNGDGEAEYVMQVIYDLDEVLRAGSENVFYYRALDIEEYTPTYLDGYTPEVNDIVLYALIDGKAQMHEVEPTTVSFKAVNYKEETATDTDNKEWEQSYIRNHTELPDKIVNVNENIPYSVYVDDYGYIRAYGNKTTYALVTEIYPTTSMNGAWLTSHDLTAEVMTAESGVVNEYALLNNYPSNVYNPFYVRNGAYWQSVTNDWYGFHSNYNYLEPVRHLLGTPNEGNRLNPGTDNMDHTWTNVAKYTMGENGINLYTAAEIGGSTQNVGNIVREDYVQLKVTDVNGKKALYETADPYYTWTNEYDNNKYARAVKDTEIFVVAKDGIRHYTGWENMPELTIKKNGIRAMYAVAEQTTANSNNRDYWTANVIVVEMERWVDDYDSIALVYSNNYKISGSIKYLQVIDSKLGKINVVPTGENWPYQFNDRGFYAMYNVTPVEGEENTYSARLERIGERFDSDRAVSSSLSDYTYNGNGVYYGIIDSFSSELTRDSYITVLMPTSKRDTDGNVMYETTYLKVGGVYGIDGTYDEANEAVDLLSNVHANQQIERDDEIVWVGTKTSANFIVDLTCCTYDDYGYTQIERAWHPTPGWLYAPNAVGAPYGFDWPLNQDPNNQGRHNTNIYDRFGNGWGEANYLFDEQTTVPTDDIVYGTFYGHNFGLTADGKTMITVNPLSYAEAAADGTGLKINKDYWENIVSTTAWNAPADPVGGVTVTITMKAADDTLHTFYLKVNAADDYNDLVTVPGYVTVTEPNSVAKDSVNVFIDQFIAAVKAGQPNRNQTFEFFFKNAAGFLTEEQMKHTTLSDDGITDWGVIVRSESGEPHLYTESGLADLDVDEILVVLMTEDGITLPNDNSANPTRIKEITKTADGYVIEVEAEGNTEPVLLIGEKTYKMTKGASYEKTLVTVWTALVTEDVLGDVKVVYVRAFQSGEKTENLPNADTSVEAAQTELKTAIADAKAYVETLNTELETLKKDPEANATKIAAIEAALVELDTAIKAAEADVESTDIETLKGATADVKAAVEKAKEDTNVTEPKKTYAVTKDQGEGTTLTITGADDLTKVEEGTTLTLTAKLLSNYENLVVMVNGEDVTAELNADGEYEFTVTANVTVETAATEIDNGGNITSDPAFKAILSTVDLPSTDGTVALYSHTPDVPMKDEQVIGALDVALKAKDTNSEYTFDYVKVNDTTWSVNVTKKANSAKTLITITNSDATKSMATPGTLYEVSYGDQKVYTAGAGDNVVLKSVPAGTYMLDITQKVTAATDTFGPKNGNLTVTGASVSKDAKLVPALSVTGYGSATVELHYYDNATSTWTKINDNTSAFTADTKFGLVVKAGLAKDAVAVVTVGGNFATSVTGTGADQTVQEFDLASYAENGVANVAVASSVYTVTLNGVEQMNNTPANEKSSFKGTKFFQDGDKVVVAEDQNAVYIMKVAAAAASDPNMAAANDDTGIYEYTVNGSSDKDAKNNIALYTGHTMSWDAAVVSAVEAKFAEVAAVTGLSSGAYIAEGAAVTVTAKDKLTDITNNTTNATLDGWKLVPATAAEAAPKYTFTMGESNILNPAIEVAYAVKQDIADITVAVDGTAELKDATKTLVIEAATGTDLTKVDTITAKWEDTGKNIFSEDVEISAPVVAADRVTFTLTNLRALADEDAGSILVTVGNLTFTVAFTAAA